MTSHLRKASFPPRLSLIIFLLIAAFISTVSFGVLKAYSAPTFTIAATDGPYGTIFPNGSIKVNQWGTVTFTMNPFPGYNVGQVMVDGKSVGAVNSYTFKSVNANHTIYAGFAPAAYTLHVTKIGTGSGSVTNNPSGTSFKGGTVVTLTATPGSTSTFTGWSGACSKTSANCTVTMNGDVAVTVAFTLKASSYSIVPSAGTNGSISPQGAVSVNPGASQAFTITPSSGYQIADVKVDGVSQGSLSSYNFSKVSSNHTIQASFAATPPSPTPTPAPSPTPPSYSLPNKWYQHLNGIRMYYPQYRGDKFRDITASIDTLYEDGFRIINFFGVYAGDVNIFCGLGPIDFYRPEPNSGTLQEFEDLVAAAHKKGMAVMTWINLGYSTPGHPYWIQAQRDKGNGLETRYTRSFIWSATGTEYGYSWAYSTIARAYYAKTWDQPGFNWASPDWQNEAKNILKFWMDKGMDGLVIDAPRSFLKASDQILKNSITDFVKNYGDGNRFTVAEGPSAYPLEWIGQKGYTHVYDNDGNDSTRHDYRNFAWDAIDSGNASAIESHLANVLDVARSLGGGTYSYDPESVSSDSKRPLEVAMMTSAGVLYELYFSHSSYPADVTQAFKKILRAVNSNSALAPGGIRIRLDTSDGSSYAMERISMDGQNHALGIFNFAGSTRTITVNLTGSHILVPQTPTDLINGGQGPPIVSASYPVTLPAYGYAFYGVPGGTPTPSPSGGTVVDDGSPGWTWAGWSPYDDPNCHGGTAHGGQTNGAFGQYTFTGTGVEYYAWKGPDGGTVDILIDGISQGSYRLYNPGGEIYMAKIFERKDLANGSHTIRIVAKDSAWTMVDSLIIYSGNSTPNPVPTPTPAPLPSAWTVIDDRAPGWTWSGWPQYDDANCYGGTAHGGQTNGASGQYTFTGTEVEYYAWKGPDGGKVEIWIDGVSKGIYSLFNASTEIYQEKIYAAANLSNRSHTLRIVARDSNWTLLDFIRFK